MGGAFIRVVPTLQAVGERVSTGEMCVHLTDTVALLFVLAITTSWPGEA